MKLLLDMNLSPEWASVLERHGWQAVHWSTVGDPRASDREIMDWAATHEYVVFTHDLGFASMLALSHATGPSVLLVTWGESVTVLEPPSLRQRLAGICASLAAHHQRQASCHVETAKGSTQSGA